jgi:hypothetical protein
MVRIYCRYHHGPELCEQCRMLLDYAVLRIDKCKFGIDKPACNNCTVHCYKPELREEVKEVMRFSSPKMIYRHPVMAIRHMLM